MTQHRVYFTETLYGYIICDSEDEAQSVQKHLEDGCPTDEAGQIKYTNSERTFTYETLPD